MNKPINIILNTIAASAADLSVAGGVVTIDSYSFPWRGMSAAEKSAAVTAATGAITLTPTSPSAGTEYGFTITQYVAGKKHTSRVGYVAIATDTATTVCNNLRTILNAFVSVGKLDVVGSGTSTCVITSTATNPLISVGGLDDVAASASSAGTAGVNEGDTLLSEGVSDSFDADLPLSGSEYTLYELALKLPKGYGGFNGQTSDQEITLNLWLDEGATNFAALEGDVDDLIAGVDATTASWNFSDALAV